MKISDIHKAFKVTMDKNALATAYGGCPAFLPEEEDLFLNLAYVEVVSNKFIGTTTTKTVFEGSVNRIADLEGLVHTDTGIIANAIESNVVTFNNFKNQDSGNTRLFYVSSILHFSNDKSVTCTLVDHETARKFLLTYNNNPWINTPVATIENNNLKVHIDTYSMLPEYSIDITYVKYPTIIDYTMPDMDITEITDKIMYEVINRAAVIALENIESLRIGSKVQINNLQE